MKRAIKSLINDVPHSTYGVLLAVMCIGMVLLLLWKGRRAGRYISGLLLVEYIFLLYSSTVIFRKVLPERLFDFMPFWSYRAILEGKEQYLAENLMNVVAFVPLGLLLGIVLRGRGFWVAMMVGVGLSIGIEMLQFVFVKGFTEFDDVFHNALGCMIGYGLYSLGSYGCERLFKRHVAYL